MQTSKGRASPKESPTKVTPRPTRQLKVKPVEQRSLSPSSNATTRILKDKSPKVIDRRSPRSLVCEKRPSKLSELESQIFKLQNDLKTIKDQLVASELSKKEAQADAEDLKRQLIDVSLKLEASQKQLSDASNNPTVINPRDISQEDQIAESMRHELEKTKVSEAEARNQVNETLLQLLAAKDTINALRSDVLKSSEAYKSIASELQQSRGKVNFLECFINNLKQVHSTDLSVSKNDIPSDVEELQAELPARTSEGRQLRSALEASEIRLDDEQSQNSQQIVSTAEHFDQNEELTSLREAYTSIASELQESRAQVSFLKSYVDNLKKLDSKGESKEEGTSDVDEIQLELQAVKSEMEQLKSTLESSEKRFGDELSYKSFREAELSEELKKANAKIDELKAGLIDKETESQGFSEEYSHLNTKVNKSESSHMDQERVVEVAKLKQQVAELKAHLKDKDTELQNVLEEDEVVKLQISKREMDKAVWTAELEAARATEAEALTKLGYMTEEVAKSNTNVAMVHLQLETAEAANTEMEAELRRTKIQSDQWRKAAETAASMLSPGNDKYSPASGRIGSPYFDEYDDDSCKKKNGNVLKKIGGLWKKPQK